MIFFFLLIFFHLLIIITFFTFPLLLIIATANKDKATLITLHPYFLNPNLHILLKNKKKFKLKIFYQKKTHLLSPHLLRRHILLHLVFIHIRKINKIILNFHNQIMNLFPKQILNQFK